MKLDFDWELGLFHAVEFGWGKVFGKKETDAPGTVTLAEVREPLLILARALTGLPVEIKEAEDVGGRSGDVFLFPRKIALHPAREDNRELYVFRTVAMALTEPPGPVPDGASTETHETIAGYRTVRKVLARYPGLNVLVHRSVRAQQASATPPEGLQAALCGLLLDGEDEVAEARALNATYSQRKTPYRPNLLWGRLYAQSKSAKDGEQQDNTGSHSTGREVKASPKENVNVIHVDEEKWKKKPIVYQLQDVETMEEFNGSMRQMDGTDTIQEDADAMQDLNLREVIRSSQDTRSIFKADLMLDTTVGDVRDAEHRRDGIPYDEWDAKAGAYKKNWCTVFPEIARDADPLYAQKVMTEHRKTARRLAEKLARVRSEFAMRPRHTDGPEIDLDAVVDLYATLRSGHTPSERLYVRPVRAERDVALQILVDLSLSTDSYVDGRRVLDVARESLVLLGETWLKEGDQLGIAGFYSNTRHSCHYLMVKGMDEPWARAKHRLGALTPNGYTRIGPAIRHATAELRKVQAKQKCLLLLTDGKPNDYDRYEGRHGIADVKQAVRESAQSGILVHALAIEASARDYLPAMLGRSNFQILPRPEMLAEAMTELFVKLRLKA